MISDKAIRILYILPHGGDGNSLLKCTLQVASLDEDPNYEALSYVWGNSDNTVEIDVSDRKVGITKNLHDVLKRLRLATESRALWVDQLCINQWDTEEKAQQVRLMRHIYSKCRRCFLWMGEIKDWVSMDDARAGVEVLQYMAAVFKAGTAEGIAIPACLDSDESFSGPFKAIETLSIEHNPWWARVWTVQEAVLPPENIFLWGPFELPWETMRHATKTWTTNIPYHLWQRISRTDFRHLSGLMAMIVWLAIAKYRTDTPAQLVQRWRFREATDPRDKVYGLLGLCSAGALPTVEKCDYTIPATDIFCDLTIDLMLSEESLLPLIMDPRLEAKKATPGIPRWALDASHISDRNTDWFHFFAWRQYNAHGGRHLNVGSVLRKWQENRDTLELMGVFVDTIEVVGEDWPVPPLSGYSRDVPQRERIREWESLAKKHVKQGTTESSEAYPGGYTFREAFGRLILGDLLRNGEQIPKARASEQDVDAVYKYLETGERQQTHETVWHMMCNQRFFVTKTGLMGMGHMDTQPGEEVWVFHGGNVPFTVQKKEGDKENEYDFGGKCYVQGIMNGEAFAKGQDSKIVRIY